MDAEFVRAGILFLAGLLDKYAVRMDYSQVDSNVVYPEFKEYDWVGVVNDEFVNSILSSIRDVLEKKGRLTTRCKYDNVRVANKYAIPFMMTANGIGKTTTWFLYQHDNNTWLIKSK